MTIITIRVLAEAELATFVDQHFATVSVCVCSAITIAHELL